MPRRILTSLYAQVLVAIALAAIGGGAYYVMHDAAPGAPGAPSGGPGPGAGFGGGFGGAQPPLVTLGEVRREQLYDTVDALGFMVEAVMPIAG